MRNCRVIVLTDRKGVSTDEHRDDHHRYGTGERQPGSCPCRLRHGLAPSSRVRRPAFPQGQMAAPWLLPARIPAHPQPDRITPVSR
jgi:hypothetical protein